MREESCPSAEQLSHFVLGKLAEERLSDIAQHLDDCDRCRGLAESFEPATDALLDELRGGGDADPYADEPELRDALAALLEGRSSASPSPRGESVPLPAQFGRYQVLETIGAGAMGTVYLAHDTQLERQVALKVPHVRPDSKPKLRERFIRESKAAAAIHHPHICQVFDAGEIDGIFYYAMSFVDGRPLSQILEGGTGMPVREAVELVRTVALAMQEAHNQGVIHRDLKPENIILNRRGEPVITDFGLASRSENLFDAARLTYDGMLIGSPAYMSPEQVHGDVSQFGPSSDIYSLGVIFFELLAGERPFDGTVASVLAQIARDPAPAPSSRNAAVSPALDAICLRAMAKEPADRFGSMGEFAARLDDYLAGRLDGPASADPARRSAAATATTMQATGIDEPPTTAPRGFRDFARRNRLLFALLAVTAGLLVAVPAASSLRRPQEGTIRIHVEIPGVVEINEKEYPRDALSQPLVLPPGDYLCRIKNDGIIVGHKPFSIRPGDNGDLYIRRGGRE